MKAGRVVYIRVNPKDCMSCIDVCQKVGTVTRGMSFAQLVSLALSSLLETVRVDGAIPVREGYEYLEMMAPWEGEVKNTKLRVKLNRAVELQGSEFIVPPLPAGGGEPTRTPGVDSANPRIRALERQVQELHEKNKVDPLNAEDREEEITILNQQIAEEYAKEQQR